MSSPVQTDEASPREIVQSIRKVLGEPEKADPNISVGLHYTGGTKAMATHAYCTVSAWAAKVHCPVVFSYLDARHLEMVLTETKWESVKPSVREEAVSVADALPLTLDELVCLHQWTIRERHDTPLLPEAAAEMAKACACADSSAPPKANELEDWALEACYRHYGPPEPGESIEGYLKRLACSNGWQDTALKEWPQDKWLEHHVLAILRSEAARNTGIHDAYQSFKTYDKDCKVDFELDAIALCGYQLFAFSCCTSTNKATLKLKLFEAALRARQLGGDEACAALVCRYENYEAVEREARQVIQQTARCKVFGKPHLADLAHHILTWVHESHPRPI